MNHSELKTLQTEDANKFAAHVVRNFRNSEILSGEISISDKSAEHGMKYIFLSEDEKALMVSLIKEGHDKRKKLLDEEYNKRLRRARMIYNLIDLYPNPDISYPVAMGIGYNMEISPEQFVMACENLDQDKSEEGPIYAKVLARGFLRAKEIFALLANNE